MKPNKLHCTYCDENETCTLKHCNRGLVFYANGTSKMVARAEYNKLRIPERTRAYRESRVTKVNF